jgi:threonine aldolase
MLSFASDYVEGAHPEVLDLLVKTNMEQLTGYGTDIYTLRAKEKIKIACGMPEADVYFLTGGTQTNQIAIATLLDDCEGVVAAVSGHINTHEAGAIEYTGHKVMALPSHVGKIDSKELKAYLSDFFADANNEHMIAPGMVYISYPTEYGTLYTKEELEEISGICREYEIPLYMDGARLGYGLMSDGAGLTLCDIAKLCDVFYIGGTKVGALCGEALVFSGMRAPSRFVTVIKRHGALLAKGRLNGIQFDALFTDGLYFRISRHAIDMAKELVRVLKEKGYEFFLESPTNQQFVILDNKKMTELAQKVEFSFWEALPNDRSVVRFATSWATNKESIEALLQIL